MGKKDLLERLSRAPSEPPRPRRKVEEEPTPARRPEKASVTQRVGQRILRRSRRSAEAAAAAAAEASPAVRRSTPPSEESEQGVPAANAVTAVAADAGGAEDQVAAPEARASEAAPPSAEEAAPAPPAVAGEAQGASKEPEVDARADDAAADLRAQSADATTAEPESEPKAADAASAGGVAAALAQNAEQAATEPDNGAAVPASETPAGAGRRRRDPASAAAQQPAAASPDGRAAEPPASPAGAAGDRSFPGLGSAVVMPPPGYDPANPMAYRRQQDAEQARPQAAAPGAAATPAPGSTRGRRRVEPGGGAADVRGRGRRERSGGGRGYDRRPQRKPRRKSGPKQASPAPKAAKRKVKVDNVISVRDLSMQLGVKASVVIRHLMDLGTMAKVNDMLDVDTATLVAAEFEYGVENVGFLEENYLESIEESIEEGSLEERPPVVTIMGHVDHGKTTLLDTIRDSRVAAGEAGGITQHIGAYQVEVGGRKITFIDTPGHEAFTAMRARGASVTDVVILVVAADDGVQPQTIEAIAHSKAAGVPIVVAVNKMDKDGVTAEPIMTRLAEHELVPEEWGGDVLFVPISALKNEGIDNLLDAVLLQADVVETKANPERFAEGIVLEAKMERGRGAVATALIQRGTLNRGDHVVLGSAFGKVRAMLDYRGKPMKVAGPSTPVELFGLSELPEVGDTVNAVKSEKNARALADHRAVAKRQEAMANTHRKTAEDLFAQAAEEDRETMLLILKADVGGSLQALKAAIEDIVVGGAEVRILLASVGDINESDINLAASDSARLIGFNVKVDARARKTASQLGVEPELYTIIYEVLDRIEREMKGMLAPVYELVREGTLEVRQLFRISRIGTVAGSYVIDGRVARNHHAKVLREGKVIWEGKVSSLKRFKDDVREVANGYECGLSLDGFDELEEGDLVESYSEQVVEQV